MYLYLTIPYHLSVSLLQKYDLRIRDPCQPMLIHRSKARDIRAGMPELVYLVPELCRQTGLSDEMRANFRLMRALDGHTKIGPDKRIAKLLSFNKRLTSNKEVVDVRPIHSPSLLYIHHLYSEAVKTLQLLQWEINSKGN